MNTLLKKVTLTIVLAVLVLGATSSVALAKYVCDHPTPPEMHTCHWVPDGDPGGGGGGGSW